MDSPERYYRRRIGAWRAIAGTALIPVQAAPSRLFAIRNTSPTNKLVIERLFVQVLQIGAFTAAIEAVLGIIKVTGYSAVDTVNVSAISADPLDGGSATATPGSAIVTAASSGGIAAGMTGATLVREKNIAQMIMWFLATVPTASSPPFYTQEVIPRFDGWSSPTVILPNEGIIIENKILLDVAALAALSFDITWSEVPA